MELKHIVMKKYMEYAKATIIERAIVSIDGLKPVQRRILYTMASKGLQNKDKARVKSLRVNGDTTSYHPTGDSSIYEALVTMSQLHEKLNVPYVDGKGNFGSYMDNSIACAAPRYTEVKLMPVVKELVDGLDEDAVDFVPNYDNTLKEPTLLPVKFPSILVNANDGMAVGYSNNIPTFSLKNVCDTTIKRINGQIQTYGDLAESLGHPEFPCGGFIHTDHKMMEHLCATGKGKFEISGQVMIKDNVIFITKVPFTTKFNEVYSEIQEKVQSKELNEVSDVVHSTDKRGMSITVVLKRGTNARDVLKKLSVMTSLRDTISYRTYVVSNGELKEPNLMELLDMWIDFRQECIRRVAIYRDAKMAKELHLLSAWAKVASDLRGFIEILTNNTKAEAAEKAKEKFGLDDEQVEYLMGYRISKITKDGAEAEIKKIRDKEYQYNYNKKFIMNENMRKQQIVSELNEIKVKYGKEKDLTMTAEPLTDEDRNIEKEPISDRKVWVDITKKGLIKKAYAAGDVLRFNPPEGDSRAVRLEMKDNEYLLVYTVDGVVHKILAYDIDSSRGGFKDNIARMLKLLSFDLVARIEPARDFTGHFNMLYSDGRGIIVEHSRAAGKRAKYANQFKMLEPGKWTITTEDKFFIITNKDKAAYIDLTMYRVYGSTQFKVARLSSDERIVGILPLDKVTNKDTLDFEKFTRGYTIKIRDDIQWEERTKAQQAREEALRKALEEAEAAKEAETDEAVKA